jgi:N-methylhydantoinase B
MHRGGFGAIYEIELLDDRGADVALLGERGRHAPFGVAGGSPAALNRFYFDTDHGRGEPPMASKITGVRIKKGQRVRLETPGGGGYGDPRARSAEAVRTDIANGLVSVRAAREIYGVVVPE